MTEIPEHLLKRSRERRAALGLGDDDAGTSNVPATTESAPAKAAASAPAAASGPAQRGAAPEPTAPKPPPPVHPTVIAATKRRKVPFWAMAALSLMPLWLFMYARALTPTEAAAEGPIGLGAEIYSNCASCHGGAGGGGVGYAFTGGEVLRTYPNIEDMLRYVYYGTGEYNIAGVTVPGDPDREGGAHVTGGLGNMPQFGANAGGALTDDELLAVVCHERYSLGGADPTSPEWAEEYETWCSEGSPVFSGLQGGAFTLPDMEMEFPDIIPIGTEPVEGQGPR